MNVRLLRWKFIQYKLDRLLGVNQVITLEQKFKLVNTLFATFLQAMEYHPYSQLPSGAGLMHGNTHEVVPENLLTELDKKNAEDILIIAIETIYELKVYDWTVLNPINFILITMLEHGIQYFPGSLRIKQWMIKVYSKLGLASKITQIAKKANIDPDDKNFERIGAARFSVYSDFGMSE